MNRVVILDAGPLGMLAHPRPNARFSAWYRELLAADVEVIVPEIADYEVRRELIRAGLTTSRERLDDLKEILTYVPITTETMVCAAQLWANARNGGFATAGDESLDGDVILAAMAIELRSLDVDVVVATTNSKHLSRFIHAKHWDDPWFLNW